MPSKKRPTFQHTRTAPSQGDSLVLLSIALVVAAIVVGLHVQMGLPLGIAALTGMSLFVGLVGFQAWRRGEAERAALRDELHRLEAALTDGRGSIGSMPSSQRRSSATPSPSVQAAAAASDFGLSSDTGMAVDLDEAEVLAKVYSSEVDAPHFEAYRGVPTVPPGESFGDYWQAHDPARQVVPPIIPQAAAVEPAHGVTPDLPDSPEAASANASAVREDDVEMLQRRIKDMLYQVTAAEQARDLAAAMPPAVPVSNSVTAASLASSLETSLDALHAAAQSMRKPAGAVAAAAAPAVPVYQSSPDPLLLSVREAIAAGRVDVFLEPILGLGNQTAQHYEVSIKLRGPTTQDLGTGEGDVIAGRGLLPLFDAVRIERSAIVAERLASRGKAGAVFSRASGEALIEPEFTRNMQMDFVARPNTARQLILTFAQSDIRAFRAAEQRAVSALSALGFRFAISGLTDLDMNFAAMAKAGFGFVKLDAAVMLEGLPHPGGHIPASDVCRFLADQGFGLIVEGIDSEETLARVYGFGALMGQGTLFGGRRPVKADVAGKPGRAAA
jgi:cyclic-di-GMP phosphodiesterase, flagellum assembly factor TipF